MDSTFLGESAKDNMKKIFSSIFEKEIDYYSIIYPFSSDLGTINDVLNINSFGFLFYGNVKGGKFIVFKGIGKNKIKE